jgi:hypothetical protein
MMHLRRIRNRIRLNALFDASQGLPVQNSNIGHKRPDMAPICAVEDQLAAERFSARFGD